MAIAFVTSAQANGDGGASTTRDTTAFSISSGQTVLMGFLASTGTGITSVVWDPTGVNEALSLQASQAHHDGVYTAYLYAKLAPTAASSKIIKITAAGSIQLAGIAVVYSGVGAFANASNNSNFSDVSSDYSVTPTISGTNSYVSMCAVDPFGETAGSGYTQRGTTEFFSTTMMGDSGSVSSNPTMHITAASAFQYVATAWVELQESGGGGGVIAIFSTTRAWALNWALSVAG